MSVQVAAAQRLSQCAEAPQLSPSLRHNRDASAPNPDAASAPENSSQIELTGVAVPMLFVLWDGQRRPRCYGRVVHPWVPSCVTPRQHKARSLARNFWVVLCTTAAGGRATIDILRSAEVHPDGSLRRSEALRPITRLVLDCGKNARTGRGVAHV